MCKRLSILIVEDSESDTELIIRQFQKANYDITYERVETDDQMMAAIEKRSWDLVIADYFLPEFNAPAALAILQKSGLDIPFVVVSGAIGEETAIEIMKAGAHDYIMKNNMSRLVPAIERELKEAESRVQRKQAEELLRSEHIMLARTEGIAHIGSWGWNIATDTVNWSDELFRIFQRDPREGAPSFAEHPAFYHPDDMARLQQAVKAAVADGTPYKLELRAIRKDGETRVCVARGVAKLGLDGRPVRLFGSLQDVTELKREEEKLRKSEENFRLSLDDSPLGVRIVTAEGETLYANQATLKIYGYDKIEELKKTSLKERYTPESYAEFKTRKEKRERGEAGPSEYEISIVRKNGEVRHIQVFRKEIWWNGARQFQVIYIDITERKRAEEALLIIKKAMESSSDAIGISDPQGHHFYQNKAFSKLFEYTPEELDAAGGGPAAFVDKKVAREMFDTIKGGLSWSGEVEMVSKSGRKFPVLERADAIKDESGKIIGLIGLHTDITDRKRAEEALRESNEHYRLLADNVNDVIFVLDMNLNYTYVSPSVKILRGFEPAEVLKLSSSETLTPASWDLVVKTLSEVMELEKSEHKEVPISRTLQLEMWRKDGTTVWTEVKISFIRDENQRPTGILGLTRDITERRKAEAELQQTLDSLKNAVGATIQALVSAVESRDPYTAGHQLRVADLARTIATEMGFPQEKIEGIRMAGSIHDIGKLSIPAEILSKPTKLTDIEFSLIKEHSRSGYEMLKDVESPWPLAQTVYQHHERMNGSGYPRNLKGNEILIEARIMAVADVVEAMASHRHYRPGLGIDAALAEIEKNKGTHYDNTVTDACLKLFREKGYKLLA